MAAKPLVVDIDCWTSIAVAGFAPTMQTFSKNVPLSLIGRREIDLQLRANWWYRQIHLAPKRRRTTSFNRNQPAGHQFTSRLLSGRFHAG
jgi:hypothetical protein